MNWDDITKDVADLRDGDLRKAVKERTQLKITRLLKDQYTYVDPQSFYYYAAVAYGLNDQRATEQLCDLKRKQNHLKYGCSEWGRWLHSHDIEPFAKIFGLWDEKCWLMAGLEMINHERSDELHTLLSLCGPNGMKVMDPLRNHSEMLWESCVQGKKAAFDVLLPVSDFKTAGHRCFVGAVYNNHLDIAHSILSKCVEENIVDELRLEIDDFMEKEAHTLHEIQSGNIMYALIDKITITRAVEEIHPDASRSIRKM